MKCPACGRENRENAGFCAWCGVPVANGKEGIEAETGGPAAAVLSPVEESSSAEPQPQQGSNAAPEASSAPAEQPQIGPPAQVATGPMSPGGRLAGRYEIVELLESTPERNAYRVRDLQRCAACGDDGNTPGSEFCRACGAGLDRPSYATLVEQIKRAPERYDLRFEEKEREYFVTLEPSPTPEEFAPSGQASGPRLRLVWGKASHQGLQRSCNEDYLEAWLYARGSGGTLGLFVVADGLGGQDSGEVASRMATDAVWQSLRESVWEPIIRGASLQGDALEESLCAAVMAANQAVYDARISRNSMMSSTLTLALIVEERAFIGNVGDSRTYLWNAQGLRQITKDHSLVQRLVDTGQILAEEVYVHPQRNLIYQSIGDRPEIKPDSFRQPLASDDRLLLCSDGLWEMVRNEGLEEVLLAEPEPQRACERLVHNANLAGGEDNISVIIVQAVGA